MPDKSRPAHVMTKKQADEARKRTAKFLVRGRAPRFDSLKGKNKRQRTQLNAVFQRSRPGSKFAFCNVGKHTYGSKPKPPAESINKKLEALAKAAAIIGAQPEPAAQ